MCMRVCVRVCVCVIKVYSVVNEGLLHADRVFSQV